MNTPPPTSPDRLQLTVYRTASATVIEIVTAVINIMAWAVVGYALTHATAATTGADSLMRADLDASDLRHMVIGTICCSAGAFFELRAAYKPLSSVKMPMTITSVAQLVIMVHYARIMAILLSVFNLALMAGITQRTEFFNILMMVLTAVIVLFCVGSVVMTYMARDRRKKTRWRLR